MKLALAFVFSLISAFAVNAATAYVAEGGDDSTAVVDDADHPFASIQSAVTALGDEGGTVSVAKGTYTETTATTCVTISAPVEVVGATGNAEDVIVTRGTQTARIFKLDNAGAKIKYLTVKGGITTGAGAYVTTNGGTFEDCIFDSNRVNDWNYVGGIYMEAGLASRIIVRNHTTHGHSNIRGVGIYLRGSAVCEDSLFHSNAVDDNGTVYMQGSSVLRNCTIADNSGATGYVGVWVDSASCRVENCLIFGNWSWALIESSLKKKAVEAYRNKGACFYNCVSDVAIPSSTGCQVITVDPFVDRANADYRTTAALRERPTVGYAPVSSAAFSADFRIQASSYLTGSTLTFEAGSVGAAGSVTYAWDFGDGTTLAASATADVAHEYSAAGSYTITMTASDGTTQLASSHGVQIGEASISVASGGDIQAAIDAAVPGTVIHLAAGTYKPSATLSVTKGVTLVGDGGATNTVITAQNKRTVISIDDFDAVLRNVTITGGKSDSGAGIKIGTLGGTVEGCIVTNNNFVDYGCRGTGINMQNGRIQRCVVARNSCQGHDQSYAPGILIAAGQVLNSLIAENTNCKVGGAIRATSSGVRIVNCTIVGNVGTTYPAIYSDSEYAKFINCAIFDNSGTSTDKSKVFGGKVNSSSFVNCACVYDTTDWVGIDWKTGSATFADAANHNYRLAGSASICFDNGCDPSTYVTLGDLDLDGNPRQVDQIDIGCFENQKDTIVFDFTVASDRKILPAKVTLTPAVDGSEDPYTVDWYVSNTVSGVVLQFAGEDDPYVWNAEGAGVYTIWGVAHIGTKQASSILHSECLQLSKKDIYVLPVNENAAWPYETEATAATNIADAVRAAADGAIVHVLPGETALYPRYEQVDLTRAITVQGEAPNRGIMITNSVESGVRRFFSLKHTDALVANFTFAGGYASGDGGANFYISEAGGTVSNCLVKGGKACDFAGYCAVATMGSGLITHCEITGEVCSRAHHTQPDSNGAILISGFGSSCKVQNCYIHDLTFTHVGEQYYNAGPLVQVKNVDNVTIVRADIPDCADFGPGGGGINCYGSGFNIRNCAVVDVRSLNKLSGATCPFYGTASSFVNCVGDAAPMNDTCKQSTPAAMFEDYANGDLTPKVMGPLYNKGAAIAGFDGIKDFAGNRRIFSRAIDVGAFESQQTAGLQLFVR